jgi:ACS family hexuronate transporter-like MFS transporter
VLQQNGSNYTPIFLVCGTAYVAALIVIHLLAPRLERVSLAVVDDGILVRD